MTYKPKNLKTWLTGVLRRASLRWPARREALVRSRSSRGLYRCAMCQQDFKEREIAIDHIQPVIQLNAGFTNWDDFINRLFCEPEQLQSLCAVCHDLKSAVEDKTRASFNAERKIQQKEILKAAKAAIKAEKKK